MNKKSLPCLTWDFIDRHQEESFHFFRITSVRLRHPQTRKVRRFYQLDSKDWVNVFGLTAKQELILIELYRFGTLERSIETPGGVIEDGESPIEAAKREFLEETGYEAGSIEPIGTLAPNPAVNTNRIHFYHAANLTQKTQATDEDEVIQVSCMPLKQFEDLILQGNISHALVVAGYYMLQQKLRQEM